MVMDCSACPMARAIAAAEGPAFVDDFDWTFVSADGLCVKDAWAMATTWSSFLQASVSVGVDSIHAAFATVPNYEWIEWRFQGRCSDGDGDGAHHIEQIVAMRAASLVWRTLAACRGYSAKEHPVFWKRLFGELQQVDGRSCTSHCYDHRWAAVKDSVRFFDGVAFPRFRLWMPWGSDAATMDRLVRSFCGLDASDAIGAAAAVAHQLETTLTRLALFMQPNRVVGPVEIALCFDLATAADEGPMNNLLTAVNAHQHQQPSVVHDDESSDSKHRILSSLRRQPYVVKVVELADKWFQSCSKDQWKRNLDCGRDLHTPIASRTFSAGYGSVADCLYAQSFLQWALCLDTGAEPSTSAGGVRRLNFRTEGCDRSFPVVFSALPHTQSLETMELRQFNSYYDIVDDHDVAWLCYALFHPDAASSTWRQLVISGFSYSCQSNAAVQTSDHIIELMAKGNNLHVVLGNSTEQTDQYHTATIRRGTVIYRKPEDDAPVVVDELVEAKQMDVCVSSTDLTQLSEWVLVVVVGFGEAYVRASAIDKIVARPPGNPFLTGLKFEDGSFDNNELFKLIEVAGHALKYLDLTGCGHKYTEKKFAAVTASCPQLESLKLVCYDPEAESWVLPPHVRHLELEFRNPHGSMSLSHLHLDRLRDLESLSISTVQPPTDTDVSDFVLPLLRTFPRLHQFVWDDRNEDKTHLTYPMRRHITRTMLHLLEFGDRDDVAVLDRLPTATLVALSSVVNHHHGDNNKNQHQASAIARLDKELVMLIGSFVGATVPRDLWVSGPRHYIYIDPATGVAPVISTEPFDMFGGSGDY